MRNPGGGNGKEWGTISISRWRLYREDAFAKNDLSSPYGVYEIPTGNNRDETNPRRKLGVGSAGNASVASISATVEAIEGIVGRLAMVEANAALAERGLLTEIPSPGYGYLRSSVILHETMGQSLYNDRVDGNLYELTYVGRRGRINGTCHSYANGNGVRVDTT